MSNKIEVAPPTDVLDHRSLARSLVQICDAADLPSSLLVYGAWGTGKTTFLECLKRYLDSRDEKSGLAQYHVVRFNPWEYETSPNLLLPLLRAISISLPTKMRTEALKLSLACLRSALDIGVRAGSKLVSAGLFQMKLKDFSDALDADEADLDCIKDEVVECREKFFELAKLATEDVKKRAMIVLLDDLDRCTPDNVVSLIEGVKLYLAQVPGTPVIFVWAMDRDIVSSAITSKYDNQMFNGADYLEKLFDYQTPVSRLDSTSFRAMTQALVDHCAEKEGLQQLLGFEPVDQIVDFLDIAPLRNPRTLHRIWSMLRVLALNHQQVITYAQKQNLISGSAEEARAEFAKSLLVGLIIAYRFRDWRFNVLHHRDKWPYFLDICRSEVPGAQAELQRIHNLAVVLAMRFKDVTLSLEEPTPNPSMKLDIKEVHLETLLKFSILLEKHAF